MAFKLSGDVFSGAGSAVGDIFGALGQFDAAKGLKSSADAYLASAKTYGEQGDVYASLAAKTGEDASIADTGNRLQQLQTQRQINNVLGGQRSDIAAGGLEASGSALDVIRDSTTQGRLQIAVQQTQGQLQQNGYQEEAKSYQAMQKASQAAATAAVGQAGMANAQASAAKKGGIGGLIGGALKIGGTLLAAGAFSDQRLKSDITFLDRRDDGIGHYLFRYNGGDQFYIGVLAQEVQKVHPEAVHRHENGFLMVDYDAIGDAMYQVGTV